MSNRKEFILNTLKETTNPVSASSLAKALGVSRQIIVGDVALLRATNHNILATPRGYILNDEKMHTYKIVCKHKDSDMVEEMYTIVDLGCSIINVIIEHPIYGEIVGNLHISNRLDVDEFIEKLENTHSHSLSFLTDNVHTHTLSCPSEEHFNKVLAKLSSKKFLF